MYFLSENLHFFCEHHNIFFISIRAIRLREAEDRAGSERTSVMFERADPDNFLKKKKSQPAPLGAGWTATEAITDSVPGPWGAVPGAVRHG